MFLYKFCGKSNEVLYIGKTINKLDMRIKQHFSKDGHLPIGLFEDFTSIFYSEYESEYELMIKEILWIGYHKPKYNIQYKMNEKLDNKLNQIIKDDIWNIYKYKYQMVELTNEKINLLQNKDRIENIYKKRMKQEMDIALSNHICLL